MCLNWPYFLSFNGNKVLWGKNFTHYRSWRLLFLDVCTCNSYDVCVCVCVSHSVISNSLWPHGLSPTRLLCPWGSPGKNTGVGCHSLLQGIFLTHGSNQGLLHCRQILYHLSHKGSPIIHILIHSLIQLLTQQLFIKPLQDARHWSSHSAYSMAWKQSQITVSQTFPFFFFLLNPH